MGERVGGHIPSGLLLEPVVSNARRRPQCLLYVALLQHLARPVCMMSPHPRKTISLQLLPDKELVEITLVQSMSRRLYLL